MADKRGKSRMVASRYMNATTTAKSAKKKMTTADCTMDSTVFAPTVASTPQVRREKRKASVTLEPAPSAPRSSLFKAPNKTTLVAASNKTVIKPKEEALDPDFIKSLRSKAHTAILLLRDGEEKKTCSVHDECDESQKEMRELETRLHDSVHLPKLRDEKKRMANMMPSGTDVEIARERNRADIEQMATCTMVSSSSVNINEFSILAEAVNTSLSVLFDEYNVKELQQYKKSVEHLSETTVSNDKEEKQLRQVEQQRDETRVTVAALQETVYTQFI